jgi:hypothetical protein
MRGLSYAEEVGVFRPDTFSVMVLVIVRTLGTLGAFPGNLLAQITL